MARMVAIMKKMIAENPNISVQEVARRLNITVAQAAIYIQWAYYKGDTDETE